MDWSSSISFGKDFWALLKSISSENKIEFVSETKYLGFQSNIGDPIHLVPNGFNVKVNTAQLRFSNLARSK